jgi:hypothetical protein
VRVARVVAAVRRARATPSRSASCIVSRAATRRGCARLARLGLHVTASLAPREYREHERVSTTVVNAYVGLLMTEHVSTLPRSFAAACA